MVLKKIVKFLYYFQKFDSAEYFLFTNLDESQINYVHNYKVITINTQSYEAVKYLQNNVKVSRYFKFQLYRALKNSQKYDFIIMIIILFHSTIVHGKKLQMKQY